MGLLDDIGAAMSGMTPEARQGLLTAGLSMLSTPGSFAQQVGRGGLAGLQGYQQAQDSAQRRQAQQIGLDAQQLQLANARRATARQERIDALPAQFTSSPAQQALAQGGGPTPANAQSMQGMRPQFDAAGYGAALMGIDPQAGLAWQQATAKTGPKVKEIKALAGEGGKSVQYAIFEDGTSRPLGVTAPNIKLQSVGDQIIPIDETTGRQVGVGFSLSASPEAVLSAQTARRGQDMGALQAAGEVQYITDPTTGAVTAVPKQSGAFAPRQVAAGGAGAVGAKDANEALALAEQAEGILRSGDPTGSGVGSLVDTVASWIGRSTVGAQASAQLKAISGMLVSKMPKNAGAQSDKDVQLYREMAGAVGDESKPIATRLAALETVRQIQRRYAGPQSAGQQPKATTWQESYRTRGDAIQDARNAILRGYDKAEVLRRLEAAGISDHGLK